MTERTINAREGFGRLFVLGGFALVKQAPAADIATTDVTKRATRQQRSVSVRIVGDVSQAEDLLSAIERGEDEGMLVAPK